MGSSMLISEPPEADAGETRGADWQKLARKVLATLSVRTAALPLGFVITIITSRYLLPEGRGAYALGVLTATLGSTLLSIATAVTREIGRKAESAQTIVVRALLLSIALGIAGAAVLLPLGATLTSAGHRSAQLLVLGLPALLVRQTIGGALLALGRLRLFNVLLFLDPTILLTGLLVLVVGFGLGLNGAVAAWLFGTAFTALVALVGARDLWMPAVRTRLSFSAATPLVSLAFRAGVVNLVALVNYRVEMFLLEAYGGLRQVGVYSVSVALAELLWLLSASVSTAVVAPAIDLHEEGAVNVVSEAVRHSFILTAVFGVLLGTAGIFMIPIVYGHPFAGSVAPLLLLIPGIVAYSPASVLSAYFSMRRGEMRYPMLVAGVSAAVNALLCVALVARLGARGAAIASTGGYVAGSTLLLALFFSIGRTQAREVLPRAADLRAYRDLAVSLFARLAR